MRSTGQDVQKKTLSDSFQNKEIKLWLVIYDNNMALSYVYDSYEKLLASVESSIRGYIGDQDGFMEQPIIEVIDAINSVDKKMIQAVVGNLHITIYRIELDSSTNIFRVLSGCYGMVDQELQYRISSLFSDSTNN